MEKVSMKYGFGSDKWIREMRQERQAREREAAQRLAPSAAKKPAMDSLELSSRQPQSKPGPVQFAPPQPIPVPVFVSGIDYMA